jgi:exodeoxyribonuclease VII large subunit
MADSNISLLALNKLIREKTENSFPMPIWITAEILDMQVNRTGHCYMELIEKSSKDDAIVAKNRATIWAYKFGMLRSFFETTTGTQLKSGIKILVKAEVSFHEVYGLSLNISDIDPSFTLGDMAMKRREIINKLEASGVIGMNKEIPFPSVPQCIAVISSETAAGYGDFIDTLHNNHHNFAVSTTLFSAVMQGDSAEKSIIEALENIYNNDTDFDLVILIRGGGSQADLDCFNTYDLAMNIAQFPIPILTGIGHERDETIADLVAHRSLKTPTAVAEFLIDVLLEFKSYLDSIEDKFLQRVRTVLQEETLHFERNAKNLHHHVQLYLSEAQHILKGYRDRLISSGQHYITAGKEFIKNKEKHLDLVRPEQVLARGYSITSVNGKALTSIGDISSGDKIITSLANGEVESIVGKTSKKKRNN